MTYCNTEPAWTLSAECPRCGNDLVVRHARRDHQPFIGCASYPRCQYTCAYHDALQALAYRTAALEADLRRFALTTQTQPQHTTQELTRQLTHLIAAAHPDRWAQGQPATILAHELTTALLTLRDQIQKAR